MYPSIINKLIRYGLYATGWITLILSVYLLFAALADSRDNEMAVSLIHSVYGIGAGCVLLLLSKLALYLDCQLGFYPEAEDDEEV